MKTSVVGCLVWTLFFWMAGASAAQAAEPGAVLDSSLIDKNHLEGWIVRIDYTKSHFRLLDPRGFEKRVVTKPGTIGDYRIGDKVRVEIDPGYKRASVIEKIY